MASFGSNLIEASRLDGGSNLSSRVMKSSPPETFVSTCPSRRSIRTAMALEIQLSWTRRGVAPILRIVTVICGSRASPFWEILTSTHSVKPPTAGPHGGSVRIEKRPACVETTALSVATLSARSHVARLFIFSGPNAIPLPTAQPGGSGAWLGRHWPSS